jgi:hypothetical protein
MTEKHKRTNRVLLFTYKFVFYFVSLFISLPLPIVFIPEYAEKCILYRKWNRDIRNGSKDVMLNLSIIEKRKRERVNFSTFHPPVMCAEKQVMIFRWKINALVVILQYIVNYLHDLHNAHGKTVMSYII